MAVFKSESEFFKLHATMIPHLELHEAVSLFSGQFLGGLETVRGHSLPLIHQLSHDSVIVTATTTAGCSGGGVSNSS